MAKQRTNHDKEKGDLSKELDSVLKCVIAIPLSSKENVSSEITQNICNVIEAIFIHGLKDPFFLKGSRYAKYPEPNFWPFVSKYSHRNVLSQISKLSQIKSEIGKGRAWIRIILNENSLEHYITLLLNENLAVKQFYNEFAFLRDSEHSDKMCGLIKSLSKLPFKAATNSSFLNAWTPSPLILAGLVAGKAIRVSTSRRHLHSTEETDEVGVSALDTIPHAPPLTTPTRILLKARNRPVSTNEPTISDDDCSSIYSHPSMLDRSELPVGSPKNVNPLRTVMETLEGTPRKNPVLLSRRVRAKASSQSSSDAGSRAESEKSSHTGANSYAHMVSTQDMNDTTETVDSGISENRGSISNDTGTSSTIVASESVPISDRGEEQPAESNAREVFDVDVASVEKSESLNEQETHDDVFSRTRQDETDANSRSSPLSGNGDLLLTDGIEEKRPNEVITYECTPSIPIVKQEEYTGCGTSLHDEFLALSVQSPLGNSLYGREWVPSRERISSWSHNGELDTSGVLSSSSGTESSYPVVSFDQALRSALETQHDPEIDDFPLSPPATEDMPEDVNALAAAAEAAEQEMIKQLTDLPREKGLVEQQFRCPMCRKSIGPSFVKFQLCYQTMEYYCMNCSRTGGSETIPSRVLRSWDWKPRDVSERGRTFIDTNLEKAVFQIDIQNPSLYEHVPALENIKNLRTQLKIVAMYLFNCRESVAEDLKKRIWPKQYLFNDVHRYSFNDLKAVRSGVLEKQLLGWIKHSIQHVMACSLCRQKGFICEMCSLREVIYPFNIERTHRCSLCHSVFHRECFALATRCPKCVRKAQHREQIQSDSEREPLPFDLP